MDATNNTAAGSAAPTLEEVLDRVRELEKNDASKARRLDSLDNRLREQEIQENEEVRLIRLRKPTLKEAGIGAGAALLLVGVYVGARVAYDKLFGGTPNRSTAATVTVAPAASAVTVEAPAVTVEAPSVTA